MAAASLLASYLPVQVFTLDVKPGEIVPCIEAPSAFRVTMAALDPTAPALPFPENPDAPPRATLKLIYHNTPLDLDDFSDEDDEEDEDGSDVDAIERRLGLIDDEAESESDVEENGGPSDPEKVKKARLEAVVKQFTNGVQSDEDEEDVEMGNGVNGTKVKKGKMKVTDADELDDDEDDDEEDDEDDEDDEDEAFVVCTLDTAHHYQQPLDLSITHPDAVSFQNVGTHTIYLTGNYFDGPLDDDKDDEDDDSSDDEEKENFEKLQALLAGLDDDDDEEDSGSDEESDELDLLEDPRIKELDSDEEEEVPKLVKILEEAARGKGKNKRPAESDDEEVENLDDLIKKTIKDEPAKANGEQKLSKKQLKKLKKNDGQAAPGAQQSVQQKKEEAKAKVDEEKKSAIKDSPGNGNGKKVQFAKDLEQGPTGSPKVDTKAEGKKESGGKGVKVIQGVTIDDRKSGTGAAAKKGDRVSMRYIGKLDKDGKVFDSNKKGKAFGFKLGSGEVIKGWDIGVAGMKVGGERRLTIPASLAYGSKSMPGIPSNSTLKFDIKLLTIN